MVQRVKDPALSLLWFRLQLWRGFDFQPWNFCMPWAQPEREREREREGEGRGGREGKEEEGKDGGRKIQKEREGGQQMNINFKDRLTWL